jgi:hypothetical protein
MPLPCEKCQGAAEPAAQLRTFEYEGQTLRCLELVSSCMLCGHRWEDKAYEIENSLFVEQACAEVSRRLQSADEALASLPPSQDGGEFVLSRKLVSQGIRD